MQKRYYTKKFIIKAKFRKNTNNTSGFKKNY